MTDGTDDAAGTGRLPSLDGIRAASVLVVLHSHLDGPGQLPAWVRWVLQPMPSGDLGVRAFFVLSGFLITWLLLREVGASGRVSLAGFYRRRAVRILPVIWAYLAFVAVLWACGWDAEVRGWHLLVPLTFTNKAPWWPRRESWGIGHTWSLAVEEQFYLVWPVVMAGAAVLARRRPGRAGTWLLAGVLAAVLVAGPVVRVWIYQRPRQVHLVYTSVAQADLIGWGCLLAIGWRAMPGRVERWLSWRPAWGRAIAVAVIGLAPAYAKQAMGLPYAWAAWSAQAAAIAYLIGSLVHVRRGISYRALNAGPVVWLGLVSYSLYVWQQEFAHPAGPGGRADHWWQAWPWNVPSALAVAAASYYLVERPLHRFRRRRSVAA